MSSIRTSPVLLIIGVLGIACGGKGVEPLPDGSGPATAIHFAVDTLRLARGDKQTVPVTVVDAQNREVSATVTLSVEGTGASILISDRDVTGTTTGRATLVARSGALTASLPVLVFGHPAGTDVQRVPLAGRPYGVAVGEDFALVTQLDAGTITRFSLDPLAVTATISAGLVPTGVAAAGVHALVANQHDNTVELVNLETNTRGKVFSATSTAFRTIFSSDGKRAYATFSEGLLMTLDPVAQTVVGGMLPVVAAGNGLAFGPGDSLLYVTGMYGGISVVNTKQNAVVRTLPFEGQLQDVVVSPDGTALFVANESSIAVAVISASNGDKLTSIPVGGATFGLAISPDGKQIWATLTAGYVAIIDATTRALVKVIDVPAVPRRVAFDRFGTTAIVSDEYGSVIRIR